jgi:phosphomethylpyrimidine synthase
MTTLEAARQGIVTDLMAQAAAAEGIAAETLRQRIAEGTAVICRNNRHTHGTPLAVGLGLRTKVNANIGTSRDDTSIEDELFAVIEKHARAGVDFITVHCGITRHTLRVLDTMQAPRLCGIVSRGGSLMAADIGKTGRENPLYEQFDRLLAICFEHDVTLSLGDGLRPGATADANDAAQIAELMVLGELTRRSRAAGVQVMIEGPGHVPLHQIVAGVQLQKRLCEEAPFYVLGPLVTDIAPGYDHITSAIGGAIAAGAGVDFLCYVTPAEHLRLPDIDDVREGVIAARIAAHAGDIVKGVPGAIEKDNAMARCRKQLDWEGQFALALDPAKARRLRAESGVDESHGACTMCGAFCAYKVMTERGGRQAAQG